VFAAMKRSLGAGEWVRRGLGAAVLAGVVFITLGLDTRFLTRVSLASTAPLEQSLVDKLHSVAAAQPPTGGPLAMTGNPPPAMQQAQAEVQAIDFADEGAMPSLSGAVHWLNSPPLSPVSLKGKVVVVDFWTYSCINCLRSLPYVRAWFEKYKDQGLVVIGVHTPEFAFEKNIDNVKKAVADLKIDFPVAIDNDYAIWQAFKNRYWPADYFIDAQGRIRDHSFGEGEYAASEHVIQQLLAKTGRANVSGGLVAVSAPGAEAAADSDSVRSPETYIGYARAENFVSPGGAVKDGSHVYAAGKPQLNEWSLSGDWTIGEEQARLNRKDGGIVYRFHARDLHLVLGTVNSSPIRFRVTIDGKPPSDSHGADVDADGEGVVNGQRLYQLIRQNGVITDRTFEIRFLDPGAVAYAFTFG
jgi:thiol-disulfide isomerase/thioredoxin